MNSPTELPPELAGLVDSLRSATPSPVELAAMKTGVLSATGAGAMASASGLWLAAKIGLAITLLGGASALLAFEPPVARTTPAPVTPAPAAPAPAAPSRFEAPMLAVVPAPMPALILGTPPIAAAASVEFGSPPALLARRPEAHRSASAPDVIDELLERPRKTGAVAVAPPTAAAPSEAFANAARHYAAERHGETAAALMPVLEGVTDDSPDTRARAQWLMARSLVHLGMHHSAIAAFDEITRDAAHPHFVDSLPWLARLSELVPDASALLEAVARYTPEQLATLDTEETRSSYDHLLYLLGRARYDERRLTEAVALLEQVRPGSRYYVPARFFTGTSHVRLRRARPAIEAFRSVLDAFERGEAGDVDDGERLRDLAWISLARIYYTAALSPGDAERRDERLLGNALEAWTRIPVGSEYWLDAMFEQSWALFVAGENERALGRVHALLSPYFEDRYYPEAIVIEAVVWLSLCHLERAAGSVADFHARFDPVARTLDSVLADNVDQADAFEFLERVRGGRADLAGATAGLVREALGDRELLRHLAQVRALRAEAARVSTVAGDGPLALSLAQELTIAEAFAKDRAGQATLYRLRRLRDHLQERENEIDTVQLELTTIDRRGARPREVPAQSATIVADEEHQLWRFDGEYWRDELPSYRVQAASL